MATVNPDDLFAVNRNDITYSVEQQSLMASLEKTDYLAVNRADVTYKITGEEFIESVLDPLELNPNVVATEAGGGFTATVTENAVGGKQPYAFTYQWNYLDAGGTKQDIAGATTASYVVDPSLYIFNIGCEVTVVDALEFTATAQSNYVKVSVPVEIETVALTENNDGGQRPLATDEIVGVSIPVVYSTDCTWTENSAGQGPDNAFNGTTELPMWWGKVNTTSTFTPSTPIPATSLVVQIEPGPIPTLIMSTPNLIKNFAASGVAIFPAHNAVLLFLNFFIYLIISPTFLVCPCAVSTTIKSTPSLIISFALLNSLSDAPTAAPTFKKCFLTFLISETCVLISKFL